MIGRTRYRPRVDQFLINAASRPAIANDLVPREINGHSYKAFAVIDLARYRMGLLRAGWKCGDH